MSLDQTTAKNIGDSAASFGSFNAALLDDQNRESSANDAVSLHIEGSSLFEEAPRTAVPTDPVHHGPAAPR